MGEDGEADEENRVRKKNAWFFDNVLFSHAKKGAKRYKFSATTAGFEPARAKPKRFLIFLLNHSDKLPINEFEIGLPNHKGSCFVT